MQSSILAKQGFGLLLVATAAVYFYDLGRAPFVGPDEPRYAEVAREMFARGDLVTPTLGGRPWFEKPALVYWAEMAGFRLFGVSEWSARLGSALAGWLTVLLVGWLCGRVEKIEGAASSRADGAGGLRLACAGVAASSIGLIVFTRAVNFDIYITATCALSLACYFVAETESEARTRRLLLAGFYAGAGAALLSKGLVGIVIPFGVVGFYRILQRRLTADWKSVLWGVPLMLLVAASWYAPVTVANGWTFFDEFIVKHHFARFATDKYHHTQRFYFYLLILPALALPWTAFLFGGVRDAWVERRGAEDDAHARLRLFALAWVVVPVAFFSLSQSKLPGYVLPALPGAAILAGTQLWRFARGGRGAWMMRATGAVLLAGAVAAAILSARSGQVKTACALLTAAPFAIAGAWAVSGFGSRARAAGVVVLATLAAAALIASCAQEGVARRQSVRDLLRLAAERGYAQSPVVNLHDLERTSEYYAAGRLVYDERGEPEKLEGPGDVVKLARERGEAVLVIVPVRYETQLTELGGGRAEVIGDNGTVALIAVR